MRTRPSFRMETGFTLHNAAIADVSQAMIINPVAQLTAPVFGNLNSSIQMYCLAMAMRSQETDWNTGPHARTAICICTDTLLTGRSCKRSCFGSQSVFRKSCKLNKGASAAC